MRDHAVPGWLSSAPPCREAGSHRTCDSLVTHQAHSQLALSLFGLYVNLWLLE